MTVSATREGKVEVPGGNVWYRVAGDGPGVPLLTLHGGPGTGHDYMEPLQSLGDERPVVFYDQLGCGKSDIPDDLSLYALPRFVAEVDAVRRALGLDRIHLLGHSWGGMLAIEYMVGKPSGVVSLTLASAPSSTRAFEASARGLLAGLPDDVRQTIERCEAAGTTDDPSYQAASLLFMTKHVYRGEQPWPDALMRTVANHAASPAYEHMWGTSEFNPTGNLKEWDREADVAGISVPTLVTCGRHDEDTPEAAGAMQSRIPGSEFAIFENSSHMAHMEEPGEFDRVLRDFLRRAAAA